MIFKKMAVLIFIFFIVTCQMPPCNIQERPTNTAAGKALDAKVENLKKDAAMKSVKVYKPDGSLQCNQGQAVSVKEMQRELRDIKIISSEKKHDGLMRIQVCGHPTGMNNVYEIAESDLEKATGHGFKVWKKD